MSTESTVTVDQHGNKIWRNSQGQFHRTDGPAVENVDGSKAWYVNGRLHRTDGPAVEFANGDKEWWVSGKRHRTDGPAIEWVRGYRSWYINDRRLSYLEFLKSLPDHEAMYVALIHGAP